METFRCPTCLFVLAGPEQSRCPSCHKRLRRRGRPIVLGGRKTSAPPEPATVELVYAERAESTPEPAEPVMPSRLIPPRAAHPAYDALPAVVGPPIEAVLVDDETFVDEGPVDIAPVIELPVAGKAAPVQHTTIFAPSQFDPEMRQVLDDLYRKARAEVDDDYEGNQHAYNESA